MNRQENAKRNIWKMYVLTFILSLHVFSAVLIPFFTDWGKISFFQVMVLQAIFTGSIFLLETPTGAVADKWGRKTSIALGTLIAAAGFLIYTIAPSFLLFALAEIVLAIGTAFMSGADESLFYDSLKEAKKEKESKKYLGRVSSIALAGMLIAAPIGSMIASQMSIRTPLFFMSFLQIAGFLIALTLQEPKIGRAHAKKQSYLTTLKKGISFFANHKVLKMLALDGAIVSALIFFIIWVYQYKLQSLNIPLIYFGMMHAAIVLVQIAVLNTFSFWEKATGGKRKFLFYSGIITGIGFIILGITTSITLALFSILLIAAFGMTRRTLYHNYMQKHIPSAKRATVLSTISMAYTLGMTLNNLILGSLVQWNIKIALPLLGTIILLLVFISKIEEKHLRE